jgi:hypothetical protein
MRFTKRQLHIFWLIFKHRPIGTSNIATLVQENLSIATLNRDIAILKNYNALTLTGKGPSTKYKVPLEALMNMELPVDDYYLSKSDYRAIFLFPATSLPRGK